MAKQTLAIVLSVFNEEKNITACLESAKFADEIIVVDHGSTDTTVEKARRFTTRIFTQKNDPIAIDYQKNFGFEKATTDWILSLDADERIPEDLQKEIGEHLENADPAIDGYWIPRKNIIFNKWIEHSLWWPDYQLRLFRKGKASFPKKSVHTSLAIDGRTEKLQAALRHENYQSVSQYIRKMNDIYTENEVLTFSEKNPQFHWQDMLAFPVKDFCKTFFLQKGYKDGIHGLALSILQAIYTELIVLKAWEKQGFPDKREADFLSVIYTEVKKNEAEVKYWFLSSMLDHTKSPLKKIGLKLLRKKQKMNAS